MDWTLRSYIVEAIRLSASDYPNSGFKILIYEKSLKSDYFRFKPEMIGSISKLMTSFNSASLITPVLTIEFLPIIQKCLKTDNFRLNRKCVGGYEI